MDSIIGAIFPVSALSAKRIFEEQKTVFLKFTKLNFSRNSKILFYVTKEKCIYGEATIVSVTKMSTLEAWKKQRESLSKSKRV